MSTLKSIWTLSCALFKTEVIGSPKLTYKCKAIQMKILMDNLQAGEIFQKVLLKWKAKIIYIYIHIYKIYNILYMYICI